MIAEIDTDSSGTVDFDGELTCSEYNSHVKWGQDNADKNKVSGQKYSRNVH